MRASLGARKPLGRPVRRKFCTCMYVHVYACTCTCVYTHICILCWPYMYADNVFFQCWKSILLQELTATWPAHALDRTTSMDIYACACTYLADIPSYRSSRQTYPGQRTHVRPPHFKRWPPFSLPTGSCGIVHSKKKLRGSLAWRWEWGEGVRRRLRWGLSPLKPNRRSSLAVEVDPH